MLLAIGIYLVGAVGFYFLGRWSRKRIAEKEWTLEMRWLTIGVSLFSWLAILMWSAMWLFENIDLYIDWQKPVKW